MKYVDLTHTFTADMPVYPGDPKPKITQTADIYNDGFTMYTVTTGMHVGTHMDAPLHMIKNGKKISDYSVDTFIAHGCLIDARGASTITADFLKDSSPISGDILLIMTGFSEKSHLPEYFEQYPEIDKDFAKMAVEIGVRMVGMDTPSPDRPPFTVHKLLLEKGILIIENLTNLASLIGIKDFEVIALPAKFHTEAAPVRVIARFSCKGS